MLQKREQVPTCGSNEEEGRIREGGLEVNAEKTKHIFLSRHQNSGQIHDIFGNDSKKSRFDSEGN
jgi:hypothetical protein